MFKKLSTKELLEQHSKAIPPSGMNTVSLWLHNIRSMYNVGSVFRSADAFGVKEIILSGYTPHPPRAEISKTAIGAEEFVTWHHFAEAGKALEYVRQSGALLIGLEQTTESISLTEISPPENQPLCILLGNEVTGIDEELLPHLKHCLSIPQFGAKHSLNVSVAGAVVLYALLKAYIAKT